MKKILILINSSGGLYHFRKELVVHLVKIYEVFVAVPQGEYLEYFQQIGCHILNINMKRRSFHPKDELPLLWQYHKIFHQVRPDLVLTYTMKPNIYGGILCRLHKIPMIHTVTGLGSVYIQDFTIQKLIGFLNRFAFAKSRVVFFLNQDNAQFYKKKKIIAKKQKIKIVHGSGVNLTEFAQEPYSYRQKPAEFAFIARILKDKGIEEFIETAYHIKAVFPDIVFHIVGSFDDNRYKDMVQKAEVDGTVTYHGRLQDVRPIMKRSSCIILPSYGEGCGTVLQEAAAMGRPLITCDTFGCRDNVQDGYNGFLCKVRDAASLTSTVKKFLALSEEAQMNMAMNSRKKAEAEFDRNKVIAAYLVEIKQILGNEPSV